MTFSFWEMLVMRIGISKTEMIGKKENARFYHKK